MRAGQRWHVVHPVARHCRDVIAFQDFEEAVLVFWDDAGKDTRFFDDLFELIVGELVHAAAVEYFIA